MDLVWFVLFVPALVMFMGVVAITSAENAPFILQWIERLSGRNAAKTTPHNHINLLLNAAQAHRSYLQWMMMDHALHPHRVSVEQVEAARARYQAAFDALIAARRERMNRADAT